MNADLLEWLKASPGTYHSRINQVLQLYTLEQRRGSHGIGEAVTTKRRDSGVRTYGELASKTPEQLRSILDDCPDLDPAKLIARAKMRPLQAPLN